MMDLAELERRFTYHAPKAGQPERYQEIRRVARMMARTVVETTPAGREQSLALTKLEEVVMWANAAVAREGD